MFYMRINKNLVHQVGDQTKVQYTVQTVTSKLNLVNGKRAKNRQTNSKNLGYLEFIYVESTQYRKQQTFKVIQKGKVTPLRAQLWPRGGLRYSSTLTRPRCQKRVSGQQHAPAALYPRETPGTHCTGGWVGPRAGLDGRKILPPLGFDPRTVQPIAQSLYRLSYPAHI